MLLHLLCRGSIRVNGAVPKPKDLVVAKKTLAGSRGLQAAFHTQRSRVRPYELTNTTQPLKIEAETMTIACCHHFTSQKSKKDKLATKEYRRL